MKPFIVGLSEKKNMHQLRPLKRMTEAKVKFITNSPDYCIYLLIYHTKTVKHKAKSRETHYCGTVEEGNQCHLTQPHLTAVNDNLALCNLIL